MTASPKPRRPNQSSARRTGAKKTGFGRAGAPKTGFSRTGTSRTGFSRTGTGRNSVSVTATSKTSASKTGASKTGAAKTGAAKLSRPSKQSAPKPRIAIALDGKQRRYLRGLAHELQPVMQIGKAGATKALLEELDRVLETHELVKVRLLRECPNDLGELVLTVEKNLGASLAGAVGRIVILYRPRKLKPTIKLPKRAVVSPEPELYAADADDSGAEDPDAEDPDAEDPDADDSDSDDSDAEDPDAELE